MQYLSFLEFIKNTSFFNVIEYSCIPDIIRNICQTISSTMKCNFDKKMSYILHLNSLQINFLILIGTGNIFFSLFCIPLSFFNSLLSLTTLIVYRIVWSLFQTALLLLEVTVLIILLCDVCPTISRPEIICASSLDIYTYALTWLSTLFKIEVWFFLWSFLWSMRIYFMNNLSVSLLVRLQM